MEVPLNNDSLKVLTLAPKVRVLKLLLYSHSQHFTFTFSRLCVLDYFTISV